MSALTKHRVASNTVIQLVGKLAVLVVSLVSIGVITRYLGPDDYGRYALALMYVQLFGVLADVGIYTTVVRDISKEPERTEELVGNAISLRSVLSILVIVLGGLISLALPYDKDVRVGILIAGVPLLLGMITTSIAAILQARLRMGRAVIGEVLGRAAALALVVVVVVLDLGFYAVLVAAAGGAAVHLVVVWLLTRGFAHLRPLAERDVWVRLLKAGLPLGVALAINAVYFRADTLIISLFEPYEQVGLYSLAYRVLEVAMVLGTVYLASVFPVLSEAVARDPERARRVIQTSSDLLVVVSVPVVVGGALLAPEIIDLAAGEDFSGAVEPLQILLVAGGLAWINGVFGYALIAVERQASALWLNVTGLVFNVALNFLLVPRYGIVAAAIVTVASEIVILAGSVPLMRRYLGFFPPPRTLAAALLGGAAMAAVLWPIRDAPVLVTAPLVLALYAVVVYAVSPVTRAVIAGLRSPPGSVS